MNIFSSSTVTRGKPFPSQAVLCMTKWIKCMFMIIVLFILLSSGEVMEWETNILNRCVHGVNESSTECMNKS